MGVSHSIGVFDTRSQFNHLCPTRSIVIFLDIWLKDAILACVPEQDPVALQVSCSKAEYLDRLLKDAFQVCVSLRLVQLKIDIWFC